MLCSAGAGFVITLATSAVPIYIGPDDAAIGASTWYGLPMRFPSTATGGRVFGERYHTFWLDAVFFAVLIFRLWNRLAARLPFQSGKHSK